MDTKDKDKINTDTNKTANKHVILMTLSTWDPVIYISIFQFQCHQLPQKQSTSTIQSRPSNCSSLGFSLGDTEDLYCDDELHPSLENDPNMRLYTENINTDQVDGPGIFDIGDDGKNGKNCD